MPSRLMVHSFSAPRMDGNSPRSFMHTPVVKHADLGAAPSLLAFQGSEQAADNHARDDAGYDNGDESQRALVDGPCW